MRLVLMGLCSLIALEHLGFLLLEMFYWTKPIGLKMFGQTPQEAESSATLAANQGLYNGFLAAGIIWGQVAPEALAQPLLIFFLSCVLAAGVYGGMTAKRSILLVQALPAALALVVLGLM